MFAHAVIATVALVASLLSFYSGFGLGTLLLPAFALFLPVDVAVAATAVVHGGNNLFKLVLVGRRADGPTVRRFGVPAVLAAFAGAAVLTQVSTFGRLGTYHLAGRQAVVTPLKLLMAFLMLGFAAMEVVPRLRSYRFPPRHLLAGGLLSGFFGGLSGHQGALRSAFLVRAGMTPEAFVGTNAAIGALVDGARLLVYGGRHLGPAGIASLYGHATLLVAGLIAALVGALLGTRLLKKATMTGVRTLTAFLLLLVAIALGSGLV